MAGPARLVRLTNVSQTDPLCVLPLSYVELPAPTLAEEGQSTAAAVAKDPAMVAEALQLLNAVDLSYLTTRDPFLPTKEMALTEGVDDLTHALLQTDPQCLTITPDIIEVESSPAPAASNKRRAAAAAEASPSTIDQHPAAADAAAAVPAARKGKAARGSKRARKEPHAEELETTPEAAAKALTAFEEFLEETFEETDQVPENVNTGEARSEGAGEAGGGLTLSRLVALRTQLDRLAARGLLAQVPDASSVRLLALLDEHLSAGAAVQLTAHCTDATPEGAAVAVAADAAGCALVLMTAPGACKKLHREETIQAIVDLVRYHLTYNVFPAFDPTVSAPRHTPGGGKGTKRRKSSTGAAAAAAAADGEGDGGLKPTPTLRAMAARMASLLRQLATLTVSVRIQDSAMLTLCHVTLTALTVDDVAHVQLASVGVLAAVFQHYQQHRTMMFDELLTVLLKLPTTGKKLRLFSLAGADNTTVQMVTAVLLQCVQGAVPLQPVATVLADPKAAAAHAAEAFKAAALWTSYFWQELLKLSATAKSQEVKFVDLLGNLVTDILVVCNQPEWPAAQLLVEGLCVQLIGSHGLQSAAAATRTTATELLGRVVIHLRTQAAAATTLQRQWLAPEAVAPPPLPSLLAAAKTQLDRARSRQPDGGGDDDKGDEHEIQLRQVLLGHLVAMAATQTDAGATLAQSFLLAAWAKDDAGIDGNDKRIGTLAVHRLRLEEAHRDHATHALTVDALPHGMAVGICGWLQEQREKSRQYGDILLRRLLQGLDDPASHVREKVIKALGGVLDCDVSLLGNAHVEAAVQRRLADGAISVRRAAVELLGKYIASAPTYAAQYYPAIVERLTDVGVSVRKAVMGILREMVRIGDVHIRAPAAHQAPEMAEEDGGEAGGGGVAGGGGDYTSEALVKMMFRIRDEEESIQQLVVESFRERWFAGDVASQDRRAHELMLVVWQVYTTLKSQGQVALPLGLTFPPVDLLTRLLTPSNAAKEPKGVRKAAAAVADALLEGVLRASEGGGGVDPQTLRRQPLAVQRTMRTSPALPPALAMHVLAAADANMCVPAANPLRYLRTLQPYLQLSSSGRDAAVAADDAQQLQCMLAVVDSVLSLLTDVPDTVAVALNDNLGELLKRHPYHGVLFFAARCLCTLASHHHAAVATLLTLLRRFVALLEGSLGKLADPKRQLHARRGLFVVGQLTRFGSKLFASPGNAGHAKPLSTEGVLALFLQYMEPGTDLDTKCQALQACGLVLIAHPALVLTPDGKMDGVLMDCLARDAPQVLKEQVLSNLCDMVKEEENHMVAQQAAEMRLKTADAAAVKAADSKGAVLVPKINGLGDSCLSGGIVQRYWDRILLLATAEGSNTPKVRLKVLQLAEVVLRHGLVHPMSCVPLLVAMQGDTEPALYRLAARLLRNLHTSHPSFVVDRLHDGFSQAFAFQAAAASSAAARRRSSKGGAEAAVDAETASSSTDAGATVNSRRGVDATYTLFKANRASRNRFLGVLMRRLEDSTPSSDQLPYLCFCADVLAHLSYGTLEEPLWVVHNLNRLISVRGATLAAQLKSLLQLPPDTDQHTPVARERLGDTEPASPATAAAAPSTTELTSPALRTPTRAKGNLTTCTHAALALSVMLLLKKRLRQTYGLTDERLQHFSPTEAPQKEEARVFMEEPLGLEQLDLGAASSVERAEAAYRLFKSLMQSDTDDFAYEYKAPARKGRTPGKTPSKTPGKTPGGKGSAAKRTPGTGASKGGSTAKRKKTKRVDSEDEEEWQGSDDEWGDTAKKLL